MSGTGRPRLYENKLCAVKNCGKPARKRGWCNPHYTRWFRYDDPVYDPKVKWLTTEERFWAKVTLNGPLSAYRPDLGPCWIWTGAKQETGYGFFFLKHDTSVPPHRYAYELLVGSIPDGLLLDHLCRVPQCCNPLHLEPVTHNENQYRGSLARVETYCFYGHKYTKGELMPRQCDECLEDRQHNLAAEKARRA